MLPSDFSCPYRAGCEFIGGGYWRDRSQKYAASCGVEPGFYQGAKAADSTVSIEEINRLRDQVVEPEYLKEIRGLPDGFSISDVSELRDHGIKIIGAAPGPATLGELFERYVREEREVLQKAELSCEADSKSYLGGSSETICHIALLIAPHDGARSDLRYRDRESRTAKGSIDTRFRRSRFEISPHLCDVHDKILPGQ